MRGSNELRCDRDSAVLARHGDKAMWCPGKERFKVSVDLMAEPCLWRWEIRDPGTNKVVASS
jgi:hypothetical protein